MPRSHLVPKRITRRDGVETTVWVKPDATATAGVSIPTPPPTSNRVEDRPIGDYVEDALLPEELGLDHMGLTLINVTPSYDEDGKVSVSAEGYLSYDFIARRDLSQYPEDEAMELLNGIPVENLDQLFSTRYPGSSVYDSGGESPEIAFSVTADEADTVGDISERLWDDTGIVDYVNETDPGTFGARYIGTAVADLALINGGGEYRDLSE